MKKQTRGRIVLLFAFAIFMCGKLAADQAGDAPTLEQQVEGLWVYTGLTSSAGKEMPLTGIFLFKDGVFLQHAVFNGEPIKDQGAMAHYGPYSENGEWIHLVAEQTISTDPLKSPHLSNQGRTGHDVTVNRSGDHLRLVFSKGTGTVQDFKRVGPGDGERYSLHNGALAFVDGYFILVQGDQSSMVAAYGTFKRDGNALKLNIIRWTEANQDRAFNLANTTMSATFDGRSFTLDDGRSFEVVP